MGVEGDQPVLVQRRGEADRRAPVDGRARSRDGDRPTRSRREREPQPMHQPLRYAPGVGQRNVEEHHALTPPPERAHAAVGPIDGTQQAGDRGAAVRLERPAPGAAGDFQPIEPDAIGRVVVDLDFVGQVALFVGADERRRGATT
jgi:hypothetical protein